MKLPHWASVLIALAVVIIAWVLQQNSTGNIVLPVVAVTILSLIQPLLAALSPSVVNSTNVKAVAVKAATGVLMLVGVVVLAGCKGPVFPVLESIEQTVATDLASGASDEQMASDVCKDLGGSALTDSVCAGAAAIVTDVVAALVESGSISGATLDHAHVYQSRHAVKP
jgi:hypothetical protein